MSARILFILPALPDYVPYVYNYFNIAESTGREYDVVCWNRNGMEVNLPTSYLVYNHPTKDGYPTIKKLSEIYRFSRFVRKSIRGREYDAVFTYTIADSLFFGFWLPRSYKGCYVFDIRDYSPLISSRFSRWIIKHLLGASAINVISSEGFRRWLPDGYNYTVCHNTDLDKVRLSTYNYNLRVSVKEENYIYPKRDDSTIIIITIGMIRDYKANATLVEAFANKEDVEFRFAGAGGEKLQLLFESEGIKNVSFSGRYRKEEEDDLVRQADMINLFLPHTLNSDTCMGNRMYLAARLRKPIIVTDNSWQAEVVEKYNIGVCVEWDDDLYSKITNYWNNLDWAVFDAGCNAFLRNVQNDMNVWETKVRNIMIP